MTQDGTTSELVRLGRSLEPEDMAPLAEERVGPHGCDRAEAQCDHDCEDKDQNTTGIAHRRRLILRHLSCAVHSDWLAER